MVMSEIMKKERRRERERRRREDNDSLFFFSNTTYTFREKDFCVFKPVKWSSICKYKYTKISTKE